jgi:hypothetical protein
VFWAVGHGRRWATARDVLLWLVVTCLPSLLTIDAPHFERMIGAVARVALLVAIGWSAIWHRLNQWLAAGWPRLSRLETKPELQTSVAFGLGQASLGATAYACFGLYPHTPGLAAAFTATPATLARQRVERSRSQLVFVERFPEVDDAFGFDFLFAGTAARRVDFRQCLPVVDGRASGTTYLILTAQDSQTTAALQRQYPTPT